MFRFTPVGFFAGPVITAMGKAAEGIADTAIGSLDTMRLAVSSLHAKFYRTILAANLMEKKGS
jgi:hypothetical protein